MHFKFVKHMHKAKKGTFAWDGNEYFVRVPAITYKVINSDK